MGPLARRLPDPKERMRLGQNFADFLRRDEFFAEGAEQFRRVVRGDGEEQPSGSLWVVKQISHVFLDAWRELQAA